MFVAVLSEYMRQEMLPRGGCVREYTRGIVSSEMLYTGEINNAITATALALKHTQ